MEINKLYMKINKKTYSSAISSTSSPGLKDSSKEKGKLEFNPNYLLNTNSLVLPKPFLTTSTSIRLVAVVALLPDLALSLHSLQVGVVLVLIGVAVIVDVTLHALEEHSTVTEHNEHRGSSKKFYRLTTI